MRKEAFDRIDKRFGVIAENAFEYVMFTIVIVMIMIMNIFKGEDD